MAEVDEGDGLLTLDQEPAELLAVCGAMPLVRHDHPQQSLRGQQPQPTRKEEDVDVGNGVGDRRELRSQRGLVGLDRLLANPRRIADHRIEATLRL